MPVMANEPIILNVYDMVSGEIDPGEESLKIVCFLTFLCFLFHVNNVRMECQTPL